MHKIAVIMTQDFEDSEAQQPIDALKGAGHQVEILSPQAGESLKGKKGESTFKSDKAIADALVQDYDMLVIPGGHSPESLRKEAAAVKLVEEFGACGKPIAAICHGPQLMISADIVKGKTMTCFETVAVDLKNAGAHFVDQELVIDGPFVTSRKPADLPAFCDAILKAVKGEKAAV